ncbi:MAG TPA: hypothetical protein VFK04_18025 [Gemmatimonadaceae bacterium]|nr:hypothetical protein [Gemmatimonadaceae bacterium]
MTEPVPSPIPNSYTIPGARLTAGEYPGAKDPAEAAALLAAFMDAGVNAFVDLTMPGDRLEPYEHTLLRIANGRPVERLSFPIRDVSITNDERMRQILDAIDAELAANRTVDVHCWGGAGRTGIVVGCWLVRHGKSGDEALAAGVQQAHKADRITFTSLTPWPGEMVCAEGRYMEGKGDSAVLRRAAIFIGPEFGTVTRPDLVEAAREAGEADFDVLIACAFNYDAHASEFDKLGRIPVLKARMNADLLMAEDLKNTGKGNLFVIFGEPDITLLPQKDGRLRVKVNGVDVFDPSTGEVRSDGPDGIACWFIDTDYNEESFFVRQAYFLGANDPCSALETTLKAEIDTEAWATLHSDTSRPFERPKSGRIAVKVINHLGDEVMKVFRA